MNRSMPNGNAKKGKCPGCGGKMVAGKCPKCGKKGK